MLPFPMTADQAAELLDYVHHIAGAISALGIVLLVAVGIIVALLLNSRR